MAKHVALHVAIYIALMDTLQTSVLSTILMLQPLILLRLSMILAHFITRQELIGP
jgi:hypothetical protein